MKITAISDLHDCYPELPGGDLLIVAGDVTCSDLPGQYDSFFKWLDQTPYLKKILIAGNHDNQLSALIDRWNKSPLSPSNPDKKIIYLCDAGIDFQGIKIWGTPWTLRFKGINPACAAFTLPFDEDLKAKFDLVPDDTDILVSHGPAIGLLDEIVERGTKQNFHAGSLGLLTTLERVKPRLHIFGHVHEGYGQLIHTYADGQQTLCMNVSHMDIDYEPNNPPIHFEI